MSLISYSLRKAYSILGIRINWKCPNLNSFDIKGGRNLNIKLVLSLYPGALQKRKKIKHWLIRNSYSVLAWRQNLNGFPALLPTHIFIAKKGMFLGSLCHVSCT